MHRYLLIWVLLIGATFSFTSAQTPTQDLKTTDTSLAPACKQMLLDRQYMVTNGKNLETLLDPSFINGRQFNFSKMVSDYQTSLHTFAQGLWVTSPLSKTAHFVRACLDRPESCHGFFIQDKQAYEAVYCQAQVLDFAFRDVQNALWNQQYKCQVNPDAYFKQPLTSNAHYADTCLATNKSGLIEFKTYANEQAFLARYAGKMQAALAQEAQSSANQEIFYYAYAHLLKDFQQSMQTKQAVDAMNVIGFTQEIKQCGLQSNKFSQQVRDIAGQGSQQSYLLPAQVQDQDYIAALNDAYLQETSPKVQTPDHGFAYLAQTKPYQWTMPASTVLVAQPQKLAHDQALFNQTLPSFNKPLPPGDEFKKENRYEQFKTKMVEGLDPYILTHLVMQKMLHTSYQMAAKGTHYHIQTRQEFGQVFRTYVCKIDASYCPKERFALLETHVDTHYEAYQKHTFDAHQLLQDLDLLSREMTQINAYCVANGVSKNQYDQWDQTTLNTAYQTFRERTETLTQHPLFEVLIGSPTMRKIFYVYENTPFERCMTEGTAFGRVDYSDAFIKELEPWFIERQTREPVFTEHEYYSDKTTRELFKPAQVSISFSTVDGFFNETLDQIEDLIQDWHAAKKEIYHTAIPQRDAYLRFVIEHFSVPLTTYATQNASREFGYYLCFAIQDYDMHIIKKEQNRQMRADGVMVASVVLIPFTMGNSMLIPAILFGSSLYSLNTARDLYQLYQYQQVLNVNVATKQMDWQDAAIEMQRTRSSITHEWTYFAIASVIGGAFSAGPMLKEAQLLLARTSRVYRQSFDKTVLRLEELYKVGDPLEHVYNLRRTKVAKVLAPDQRAVHFLGDPSLRTAMADQLVRSTRLGHSVDDWLQIFEQHLLKQQPNQAIGMIVSDLPDVAKRFSLSTYKNTMALEQIASRHIPEKLEESVLKGRFMQDPLFRHELGKKLAQASHLGTSADEWLIVFEKQIADKQYNAAIAMVERDFSKLARSYRLSSLTKVKPIKPVVHTPSEASKAALKTQVPARIKPSWNGFVHVLEKNPKFAKARWQWLVKQSQSKGQTPQQIYQAESKLVALLERFQLYKKTNPSALKWLTSEQIQTATSQLSYHRYIGDAWVKGGIKNGKWIDFSTVRDHIIQAIGKKGRLAHLSEDLIEKIIHPLVRSHLLNDLDWTRLVRAIDKLDIQTQVDVRAFQESVTMINRHNKSMATYLRPGHTSTAEPNVGGWLKGNRKLNPNYYTHRKNYLIDHFEDVYVMQRYSRYRLLDTKYEAVQRLAQNSPDGSNQIKEIYRVIDQANPFAAPLGSMEHSHVKKLLREMEQTDVVASLLGKGAPRKDTYLQFEWRSYEKGIASLNKNIDDMIKQGKTSVTQLAQPFRKYDFHRRIRGECVTPTSSLTTVANAGLAKIMIWMSTLIEFSSYSFIHRDDEFDYETVTRGMHEVAMQGMFGPFLRYIAFTNISPIALYKMLSEAVLFSFVGAPIEALEFQVGEELIWGHDGYLIKNDRTRKQLEHALQSNPELIAMDDNPWLDWSAPELKPVQAQMQAVLAQTQKMGDDASQEEWFDWFLQKELTAQMQSNEELEDYVVDQFSTFLWNQEQAEKKAFKAQGDEDMLMFLTLGDETYQATVDAGFTKTGFQYYMFNRGWMVAPSLGVSYLTSQGIVSLLCKQRLNHLWNQKAANTFYLGTYTGLGLWYLHARNQTMGK